jgi:lipid-binding SYLF domain-containing protein
MVSTVCVMLLEVGSCRTDQKCPQVIPRSVLENAKGFAIFTIIKAGFLFSARAGSGIVIAKLEDGSEY